MRVKELIKQLQTQDPETEVILYIDEAEEFGSCDGVKLIKDADDEEMPYAKGDAPEVDPEKGIVIVHGWIV